ncbi:MMPL family transporter [Sulfuracidifex tepidarius]|uniref:SSD domain-containing protein n=1 Tax=Sulfuracidifex tepidarius TaxID=1294262 RepID=A0A510E3N0_9CREN|nr:MMPL family transporter [Sulfuracidifex tepidarius]BBG27124.1 hypothetical protein IC007_1655 [Sulfuracidifex tepidarius]
MRKIWVQLILWIVLLGILAPFAATISSYFVYSDSPFLSSNLESVQAKQIALKYFNFSSNDTIYVIYNGSYEKGLNEIYQNIYLLRDAHLITPYNYINNTMKEYESYIRPILDIYCKNLTSLHELYVNLTLLRNYLLENTSLFAEELNITYWVPLHLDQSSDKAIQEFLSYFNYSNGTLIQRERNASIHVFKDPFVLCFGPSNFTNISLIGKVLNNPNYKLIIRDLTGVNISSLELKNPKEFALSQVEKRIPPPPVSISNFHRNNSWLFLVEVPNNESLDNVERFMSSLNGASVTGHLPFYAQSAYYTQSNIEIIDVTTVALVGILLALLLRALIPIVILVLDAGAGVVLSYGLVYAASLLGYKIYYISGLVTPPIVFGISIDYAILFLYRYFEELRKNNMEKEPSLNAAFKTAGKGAIFSGISIVVGFAGFLVSPSSLLENIGLALVISSLSSVFVAVFLTYTMISIIPVNKLGFPRKDVPRSEDAREGYLERAANFSVKNRKVVIIGMFFLFALSLGVSLTHTTNGNIDEIIPSYASSLKAESQLTHLYNYSLDYAIFKGNPNASYSKILNVTKSLEREGAIVYGPASIGNYVLNKPTSLTDHFYAGGYTLLLVYVPYPVFSKGAINMTNYLIGTGWLVGGSNAQRLVIINNSEFVYFHFTLIFTIIGIVVYLFLVLGSLSIPLRLAATIGISSLFGVAMMYLVFGSVYWITPLVVFALLFGLGIDYDLFIILRLIETKEEDWNKRIIFSIKKTGLVVTAAGMILSGAFFSLTVSDLRFLQEIGFAVGVSVLFDTFVVRPILVPAILSVLKKLNWWPNLRHRT